MKLLVRVEDYHEIEDITLSIVHADLQWIELGMNGRYYVGLIFNGRQPSDEEIKTMLERNNITLDLSGYRRKSI